MNELSPEAQTLLDTGKDALSPSAATKANVLASVENAIAGGSVGSAAGGISAGKLLLVLAVAAGIGGGLWLYAGDGGKRSVSSEAVVELMPATITTPDMVAAEPTTIEASPTIEASTTIEDLATIKEPTAIEDPSAIKASPTIEASTAIEEPTTIEDPSAIVIDGNALADEKITLPSTETRAKRKIKREPSKSISGMNTLLAERKLLVAAKGAIGKHDYQGARGILAVHKREFPQGMLSAERDALRAISLCLDLSEDSGPAEAKRFLKKHGQSPIAPRVKNICKLP